MSLGGLRHPRAALDQRWLAWYAHTAGTRAADRAHTELANRHAVDEPADQRVTAEEWFAAAEDADRADDPHRKITEADLAADHAVDNDRVGPDLRAQDQAEIGRAESHREAVERAKAHVQPAETLDLRQIAAEQDAIADEDTVRVPTTQETSESVRRAERALAEIRARDAADNANAAEEARAAQLARWHTTDTRTNEAETTRADGAPVLERADHA